MRILFILFFSILFNVPSDNKFERKQINEILAKKRK